MVMVAAGAAILGTVVSMAGASAQAKGQAAAANYNAKIRERNAETADIKADWRGRLVQLDSAKEADEEIAIRDMQAETEAMQFREQGINERLEANLQRIYAKNYRTAGRYKMMSAAISGVSRTASLMA